MDSRLLRNKWSKSHHSDGPRLRGRAKFGTFLKDSIAVLIAGAAERPAEAARERTAGPPEKFDPLGRDVVRRRGAYRVRRG